MLSRKIIWLIEDNANEADNYRRFIQRAINSGVENLDVKTLDAKDFQKPEDYRELVTSDNTGAILIDYDLKRSGVQYDGADLARYLRRIKPELSIYILTAYRPDVEGLGEVEDVLPKEEMRKSASEYLRAILRSMKRYEAALTKRQKRLNELVDRKLSGKINKREETELQKLRQEIERPFAGEIFSSESARAKVEADELRALEQISKQLDNIAKHARKSTAKKKTKSKS